MSIYYQEIEKTEKRVVLQATQKHATNVAAAKWLGISNRTLRSLQTKHGIQSNHKLLLQDNSLLIYFIPFLETRDYVKAFKLINYPGTIGTYRGKVIKLLTTEVYKLFKEKKVEWKVMLDKFEQQETFDDDEVLVLKRLMEVNIINKRGEVLC